MRDVMNKVTIYIIVMTIFFLLIFLSVSAPLVMNQNDFSIYNSGWDGCSDLAIKTREMGSFTPNIKLAQGKRTEVTQRELTEYDINPNRTGMMIIGPREDFSQKSVDFVDTFLKRGGKLVLADDFGSGNDLLKGLETNSSFYSSPLLDFSFEKGPELGVAYNIKDHELTRNVSQVMLNKPTAIKRDEEAKVIMNSSRASWLDKNGNAVKDEDEEFKKRPLMTVEKYGKGELILVSDPSIFINSMLDKKDNKAMANNVLSYLSQGRSRIIFDESHRKMGFIYKMVYTGNLSRQMISFVMAAATGLILLSYLKSEIVDVLSSIMVKATAFLFEEEEGEETIAKVLNNHSEWDKDKLEMIHDRILKAQKGDG